jgi:hypothetical protein
MNKVYFAIPVAPRRDEDQWQRVGTLLDGTLKSLANQDDSNYVAIVCGHERPDCLDLFPTDQVVFLQAAFDRPTTVEDGRRDKRRKRRQIATEVRARGGGYYMYLDGDDRVHRSLVSTIRADDNGVGYIIPRGYAYDHSNDVFAPIPGAWSLSFDRVCGSSGIVFFRPEDLPATNHPDKPDKDLLYFKVRNHKAFSEFREIGGEDLTQLDFPAAVYVLNHSLNLSDRLVRTEERQQELIDGIAKRAIGGAELEAIRRDFGFG